MDDTRSIISETLRHYWRDPAGGQRSLTVDEHTDDLTERIARALEDGTPPPSYDEVKLPFTSAPPPVAVS